MKKLRLFLILTIIIIPFYSINAQYPCNTSGQTCPSGLTGPICFTMIYQIPNTSQLCTLAIYYCYNLYNNQLTTSFHHLDLADPQCGVLIGINNIDFQYQMWNRIIDDIFIKFPSIFPDCPPEGIAGTLVFVTQNYKCLKFINFGNPPTARIEPCENDEFTCFDYYYICYDNNTGEVKKFFDHSERGVEPECPSFDPAYWVPGPGQGWGNYFESVCSSWQCIYPSN